MKRHALIAALTSSLLAAPALFAQNWIAVNLHPPGATSSYLYDLDATAQVGTATVGGVTHAAMWNGSWQTFRDLHPSVLCDYSIAYGLHNGVPAGTVALFGTRRAVRWNPGSNTYIDLMPEGQSESEVWGARGGVMCGWARYGPIYAGIWTSDYTSFRALGRPTGSSNGFLYSYATGTCGTQHVGWAVFSYMSRACMWSEPGRAYVELQPSIGSNIRSAAWGTDGVQQVGYVSNSLTQTQTACLWTGSAASIVYLNPPGVTAASANDVCNNRQVGTYSSPTGTHACIWHGTAGSMVDLHAALSADYNASYAQTIDCTGGQTRVGGYAYNATLGRNEAIMWIDVTCPSITSQPSNSTACPGATASCSVSAVAGGEISYAWQYQNAAGDWISLTDGVVSGVGTFVGAAAANLQVTNVAIGSNSVRCLLTTPDCAAGTLSDVVTLTGLTAQQCCTLPQFTTDPLDFTSCGAAGQATFSVVASGPGPISYRWQWEEQPGEWTSMSNGDNDPYGVPSGVTTTTLTISSPVIGRSTNFRCRATNSCGVTNSNPATLTASTLTECCSTYTLDWSPADWVACPGEDAFFNVGVTSFSTPNYIWQRQALSGAWSNLANGPISGLGTVVGASTSSLWIQGVDPAASASIRCIVTHACGTLSSDPATLSVSCGPTCDAIDFNADGLFPDTADIDDFLSVFSGGPCSNDPNCGDIDFNNDGLFPDTADIDSLLSVFSGGACV